MNLEERFWEKVDRRGPDDCWLWTAGTNSKGYGHIKVDGEMAVAHQVSYRLSSGVPGDNWVLHTCDVRRCVNPNHLYLGDASDNLQDAWDRDRRDATGGANPNSKLTEREVHEIRQRCDSETHAELAEQYGVASSTVSMIASGHRWNDG